MPTHRSSRSSATKSADGAEADVRASILSSLPSYFLEIVFVLGIGVLAAIATTGASAEEGLVLLGLFVAAGTRVLPSSVRLITALSGIRYAHAPLEHLIAEYRRCRRTSPSRVGRVVTDAVPHGDIAVRDAPLLLPGPT